MGIDTKHLSSISTTIITIIILDQLTKLYVASYPLNTTIFNFAFFKIKYVLNTGAAFSFLTGFNELLKFIVPLAVILLFVLHFFCFVFYKCCTLCKILFLNKIRREREEE